MLIQDYCYDGGQMGESGICGNPDPALVSQWKHWKEYLLPGKPALLDMPSSGNKRVILFSLAGSQLGVIGFSVSHTAVTDAGSLYFLYEAILSLNPETVTSAIAGNEAFENWDHQSCHGQIDDGTAQIIQNHRELPIHHLRRYHQTLAAGACDLCGCERTSDDRERG